MFTLTKWIGRTKRTKWAKDSEERVRREGQRTADLDPGKQRAPRPAVGWMLGPDLIARFRKVFATRRDPRTWMPTSQGRLHDEAYARDGRLIEPPPTPARDTVWFDYISDTGDGSDATYAIAYACQIDFELPGTTPPAERPLALLRGEEVPLNAWRAKDRLENDGRRGNLPRGQFLFVGGDTAYHVADAATVHERVGLPFAWAHRDLGSDVPPNAPARLYGIPGNHDWYDDLYGFSLVFRRGDDIDGVVLPGFDRCQEGSFPALPLPHGWQLWGLDIDVGIDARQRAYFASLGQPDKLILCTPSPPLAFHTEVADKKHDEALTLLKLPHAYRADEPLPTGHCRLDLSGDVHHYARYPSRRPVEATQVDRHSYMAVVAGLGGAFHHPSFTRAANIPTAVKYPTDAQSLQAIAPCLLALKSTLVGSWVRFFPVVFALILGAAASAGGGTSWLCHQFLALPQGVTDRGPAGDGAELGRAALQLGVLAFAGLMGALTVWCFALTERKQAAVPGRKRRWYQSRVGFKPGEMFDAWRTHWPATLLAVTGAAALILFTRCPLAPARETAALDVSTLALILTAVVVAPWAAGWVGGKQLRGGRKLPLLGLGLVHGVAQVTTPLLCALFATTRWQAWLGIVVVLVVTWLFLIGSARLYCHRRAKLLAMVATFAWLGGMAAIVACGSAPAGASLPWWQSMLHHLAGGVFAIFFCTIYFAWYLAIASLLDAHNNEAGGAARVTSFRQLIRFRVDASGLTGYVISVEDAPAKDHAKEDCSPAASGGKHLRFHLRDVFTIAPGGS